MTIRSIKEQARRQLHEKMSLPALYRAEPASEWEAVTVRLHEKWTRFGDIGSMDGAQMVEIPTRMVFLVEDFDDGKPARSALVSIAEGEAFRVGEADEPDGLTIIASVARLPADQAAGLPVPDDG